MIRTLFAATIFCSAFLLFLVQPIISKQILPWFGGSAAVWTTCMVFFQVMLLAGYAYADRVTRLTPRMQAIVHCLLLGASFAVLPIVPDAALKPDGTEDPAARILVLLGVTIGLPYFLLASTGPLLQSWVSRTLNDARVYRYFSLSNLASLAALIAYPFVIEPHARLLGQARGWSGIYIVFTLLCAASAVFVARHAPKPVPAATTVPTVAATSAAVPPAAGTQLLWLALSAMGTWLLLAVTNHITQNIAAVPFLWLLPLTIYLLTFILCFESDRWYARSRFLLPAALALLLCAYGLQRPSMSIDIKMAVPVYVVGLFLFCMFLHGELAALRPAPRYLTRFYLMLAAGGALGGVVVGLVAPRLLPANYELGAGLLIVALLAVTVLRRDSTEGNRFRRWLPTGAGLLALFCGYTVYRQAADGSRDAHRMARSFYGSLRTVDARDSGTQQAVRQLYNGAIRHGEQYLSPALSDEPTSYYGLRSGVGLVLQQETERPRRVGLIGLGAGTLAAYGRDGDVFRFYEINPQVIDIAQHEFSFLRDTDARVETVLGDARLILEREPPQRFDILAIDAFSGDSIPVHLITREALAVYLQHIKRDGIIAFHVTNRFLALAPVVQRLAAERGLHVLRVFDDGKETTGHATDWVLVARQRWRLSHPALEAQAAPIKPIPGLAAWSDDFNNLFDVLK